MSLLSIIQKAAATVNTTIPTAIVGSSNADAVQWFALAQRAGDEVFRRHDWSDLVLEHTWTSNAAVIQTSGMPTGFDHFVPDVRIWNRSNSTVLTGPVPSNEWQDLIGSAVTAGSVGWWRRIGGEINIFPAPTAGQTFAYEYVDGRWVMESDLVTFQTQWNADTNFARWGPFGEPLLELNLIWKWLRAHGMDYAEEMATYERELERAVARDRGLQVHVLDRRGSDMYSWPGTITP